MYPSFCLRAKSVIVQIKNAGAGLEPAAFPVANVHGMVYTGIANKPDHKGDIDL